MDVFESRAVQTDEMITILTRQVSQLQTAAFRARKDKIKRENAQLRIEIEQWKNEVVALEKGQGVKQHYDFCKTPDMPSAGQSAPCATPTTIEVASEAQVSTAAQTPKGVKKAKKDKKEGASKKETQQKEEAPVDVGRLDLRVGRIVTAKKHPDADSLYVEEVDCGEDERRTVVSGLVKFIPEAEMQDRMVIVMCNLKPAKMRGILSQAMVMCASTPEKVELLSPPEGSTPGDLIHFEGFTRSPDSVLNPKKKIWESCAPDLKTDGSLVACYKGVCAMVAGKGVVTAQTLANVQVK